MTYNGHTFYVTNSALNILNTSFSDKNRLVLEGVRGYSIGLL